MYNTSYFPELIAFMEKNMDPILKVYHYIAAANMLINVLFFLFISLLAVRTGNMHKDISGTDYLLNKSSYVIHSGASSIKSIRYARRSVHSFSVTISL